MALDEIRLKFVVVEGGPWVSFPDTLSLLLKSAQLRLHGPSMNCRAKDQQDVLHSLRNLVQRRSPYECSKRALAKLIGKQTMAWMEFLIPRAKHAPTVVGLPLQGHLKKGRPIVFSRPTCSSIEPKS